MTITFEEWRYSHEHEFFCEPGEYLCDYEERLREGYQKWLKGPGTTVVPLKVIRND